MVAVRQLNEMNVQAYSLMFCMFSMSTAGYYLNNSLHQSLGCKLLLLSCLLTATTISPKAALTLNGTLVCLRSSTLMTDSFHDVGSVTTC